MPYNSKSIEAFITKVNEEAAQAAIKVFEKHQPELERRIKAQLLEGDELSFGMGSVSLNRDNIAENFLTVLNRLEYWKLPAGFSLPDKIKK